MMMNDNDPILSLPASVLEIDSLFPTRRRLTAAEAWVVLVARLAVAPEGMLAAGVAELAALWRCSEQHAKRLVERYEALGLVRVERCGTAMELRPARDGAKDDTGSGDCGARGVIESKKESSKEKNKDKTIRDRDENGPLRARACEAVSEVVSDGYEAAREEDFYRRLLSGQAGLLACYSRYGMGEAQARAAMERFVIECQEREKVHERYGHFYNHFLNWLRINHNEMQKKNAFDRKIAARGQRGETTDEFARRMEELARRTAQAGDNGARERVAW